MNIFSATKIASFLTALTVACIPSNLFAQPRQGLQHGTIEMEQDSQAIDPYAASQEEAIEYFTTFEQTMRALAETGDGQVPDLGDGAILHLAGTYLFCTTKSGMCPLVLDALLEVDVLKSKLSGKPQCNTLKRFWKTWVRSDMQKREGYLIQIGQAKAYQDFRRTKLPGYVKCDATVKQELAGDEDTSNAVFFKQRLGEGSLARDKVIKLVNLLKEIERKRINVFRATGS